MPIALVIGGFLVEDYHEGVLTPFDIGFFEPSVVYARMAMKYGTRMCSTKW